MERESLLAPAACSGIGRPRAPLDTRTCSRRGFGSGHGVSLFKGGQSTSSRAVVQVAGSAFRLSAARLKAEFERHGDFLLWMLRYTQAVITQISQTAVCNRHHSVDPQLRRWLLLSLDRLRTNQVTKTQELIAKPCSRWTWALFGIGSKAASTRAAGPKPCFAPSRPIRSTCCARCGQRPEFTLQHHDELSGIGGAKADRPAHPQPRLTPRLPREVGNSVATLAYAWWRARRARQEQDARQEIKSYSGLSARLRPRSAAPRIGSTGFGHQSQ